MRRCPRCRAKMGDECPGCGYRGGVSPQPHHDGTGEGERWRMIRHFLAVRSGHRCEICGVMFAAGGAEPSVSHRRHKGMGGTRRADVDDLSVVMLACGGRLAGVRGCHGRIEANPAWAAQMGYTIGQHDDPLSVPVVLWSSRRVFLDSRSPFYLDEPDRTGICPFIPS